MLLSHSPQNVVVTLPTECCCHTPHRMLLSHPTQNVVVTLPTECCCHTPPHNVVVTLPTECCCHTPHRMLLSHSPQNVVVTLPTECKSAKPFPADLVLSPPGNQFPANTAHAMMTLSTANVWVVCTCHNSWGLRVSSLCSSSSVTPALSKLRLH